jgi:hypothetical protein
MDKVQLKKPVSSERVNPQGNNKECVLAHAKYFRLWWVKQVH